MTEEMGVVTQLEVDRLMKKLSRERARVLKEFVMKVYALAVEEEFFQCYISSLPDVDELRKLIENDASTMRYRIWPTINGIMVKREA